MLAMKRTRESGETKINKMGTKIEAIHGDLNARMIRCGKPKCRCAKGELHGPYYVYRLRKFGKRHSKYIRKRDVLAVKLAVETGRAERKQARRELQEAIRTLRRFRYGLLDLVLQGKL
jgi:hypothetical protein